MGERAKEYAERPRADEIPCPFLVTAYNNGRLVPSEDGTVDHAAVDAALAGAGLGPRVREKLLGVVSRADVAPDRLDLFGLRDSPIDHTGSTGVRDPKVNPDRLPELLAFGEGGRMYRKHLAAAVAHFGRADRGRKGMIVQTTELTALLEVFGRVDERGKRYLSDADVRRIWLEGRYPEGWSPRARDSITMPKFLLSWAKTAARRTLALLFGRRG